MFERMGDNELRREMLEDMFNRHRWTRNIPPPSAPKRYDPNEPPFTPPDFLGDVDDNDLDEI